MVVTNCADGVAAPRCSRWPDLLQRVGDELAVEHRVDRAAQADQLGAVGQLRRVRQRPELVARALVVEQDAAVEVAHDDALRQLGHQRGQAAALLLDAPAGLGDLGRDVAAQPFALLHQFVEGIGQRRGSRHCPAPFSVCAVVGLEQHTRLLEQPRRRRDMAPVQPLRQRHAGRPSTQPAPS